MACRWARPWLGAGQGREASGKTALMSLLVIDRVTLRIAGRTLLDEAELRVDPGRRVGLVGRHGAGKSTLLRAIAGEVGLDGGEIRLSARARLAQVRQEAPSGPQSLVDTV